MAVAAAGNVPVFKVQDEFSDAENKYSFPTTCVGYFQVGGLKNDNTTFAILQVYGTGAPGNDYDNAPNGSLYTDMTAYKLYIKTGDTAWTVVGAQTA